MEKPPVKLEPCPHCQALNRKDQKICPVCRNEIIPGVFLAQVVPEQSAAKNVNSYSLTTLFIVVALYAVCFSVMRSEVASGVAMLVCTTIAVVVTAVIGRRRLRRGDGFGNADKMETFYVSFLASIGGICLLVIALVFVLWVVLIIIDLVIG